MKSSNSTNPRQKLVEESDSSDDEEMKDGGNILKKTNLSIEECGYNRVRKYFKENIRAFNNTFCFVSFNTHEEHITGGGPQSFKISGPVRHTIGKVLIPEKEYARRFIENYFISSEKANANRKKFSGLKKEASDGIFILLENMMKQFNPYFKKFVTASERTFEPSHKYDIVIPSEAQAPQSKEEHKGLFPLFLPLLSCIPFLAGQYHLPSSNETAIIVTGGTSVYEPIQKKDVLLKVRGQQGMQNVWYLNHEYDPLHYVLLFPRGEAGLLYSYGWHSYLSKHLAPDRKIT